MVVVSAEDTRTVSRGLSEWTTGKRTAGYKDRLQSGWSTLRRHNKTHLSSGIFQDNITTPRSKKQQQQKTNNKQPPKKQNKIYLFI